MNKSPLRYPGGKSRAIKILEKYLENFPNRTVLLSPFFGGGSFELFAKSKGFRILGNDLFGPLYTFWVTLQTHKTQLIQEIKSKMPVSKEDFIKFRSTVCNAEHVDRASSYFIINRCSFSGATMCGGFSKEASEKRLTESSLKKLNNCDVSGITFTNVDCCKFLDQNPETDQTLVYADPPYYISNYIYGRNGDLHEQFDHEAFAKCIQKRRDWIISYNDCEYIRKLYTGCRIISESWSYGMNTSKQSSEIIILPAS
jgi:DNA adenine methylase